MSEIVFILGAGASAHAKVPVMAKFLDRARELYTPNIGAPWKEHFERVLNILSALQIVHSKAELDLNNIEAVFTTFELGQTIRKLPGVDKMDFEAAVNSLKALIVYTIEQSMLFPLDEKRDLWGSIDYANFASFVLALIKNIELGSGSRHHNLQLRYRSGGGIRAMELALWVYCRSAAGGQ